MKQKTDAATLVAWMEVGDYTEKKICFHKLLSGKKKACKDSALQVGIGRVREFSQLLDGSTHGENNSGCYG